MVALVRRRKDQGKLSMRHVCATGVTFSCIPLILYSPLSWLWRLEMLMADEALEPTVSMRSNPGGVRSPDSIFKGGRKAPSSACRRVKGLRMGILSYDCAEEIASRDVPELLLGRAVFN